MGMLPYDVNAYLSTNTDLLALLDTYGLSTISIVPFNDSEPCIDGATNSYMGLPYISYYWYPGVDSNTNYFIREDRIRYHVMDRDYDRGMSIWNLLVRIFDVPIGAGVKPIPCPTNEIRVDNYYVRRTRPTPPKESGGLADLMVEVVFTYVYNQILTP